LQRIFSQIFLKYYTLRSSDEEQTPSKKVTGLQEFSNIFQLPVTEDSLNAKQENQSDETKQLEK